MRTLTLPESPNSQKRLAQMAPLSNRHDWRHPIKPRHDALRCNSHTNRLILRISTNTNIPRCIHTYIHTYIHAHIDAHVRASL